MSQSSASPLLTRLRTNRVFWRFAAPEKVLRIRELVARDAPLMILDIGCGNHSSSYFKAAFPRCNYTGVDKSLYNTSAEDLANMNSFVQLDLEESSMASIPKSSFDLVVMTHVLEHLKKGVELIQFIAPKVRPGGILYIAYPSPNSVDFPHRRGTLNFYDDPTHVTIIHKDDLLGALKQCGFDVVSAGVRRRARNLLRMLIGISFSPLIGGVTGPLLWDLYGFEEIVIARRPADVTRG